MAKPQIAMCLGAKSLVEEGALRVEFGKYHFNYYDLVFFPPPENDQMIEIILLHVRRVAPNAKYYVAVQGALYKNKPALEVMIGASGNFPKNIEIVLWGEALNPAVPLARHIFDFFAGESAKRH